MRLQSFYLPMKALVLLLVVLVEISLPVVNARELTPPAKVMKDGKLLFEVTDIVRRLGEDGLGEVREVVIRFPDGKTAHMAMKMIDLPDSKLGKRAVRAEKLLSQTFEGQMPNGLSPEISGLEYHERGVITQVVVSPLARGDIRRENRFIRGLKEVSASDRVDILHKMTQDLSEGLEALHSKDLVHGDIATQNILYSTNGEFDWHTPRASKIHFFLADFDTIEKVGNQQFYSDVQHYLPPELINQTKAAVAAKSTDIYATAFAIYETVFQRSPPRHYLEHFKDNAEVLSTIDTPESHQKLVDFMEDQFKKYSATLPEGEAGRQLEDIRRVVMAGLEFDPAKREKEFAEAVKALRAPGRVNGRCFDKFTQFAVWQLRSSLAR